MSTLIRNTLITQRMYKVILNCISCWRIVNVFNSHIEFTRNIILVYKNLDLSIEVYLNWRNIIYLKKYVAYWSKLILFFLYWHLFH